MLSSSLSLPGRLAPSSHNSPADGQEEEDGEEGPQHPLRYEEASGVGSKPALQPRHGRGIDEEAGAG